MRIYISGAITGTDDYMDRFYDAELTLKALGHTVVNPAKINSLLPDDTTYEKYMTVSLALLSTCEAIYMLNGWENSEGARKEFAKAAEDEIIIFMENGKKVRTNKWN